MISDNELQDILNQWERDIQRIKERRINTFAGEMDNVLDARDLLEENKEKLSPRELVKLTLLDNILYQSLEYVWENLATPIKKRERVKIPPSHWWWYLDQMAKVKTG